MRAFFVFGLTLSCFLIGSTALAQEPEAAEPANAPTAEPAAPEAVDPTLAALLQDPSDPKAYAGILRKVLAERKEQVLTQIDEKFERAQEKRVERISDALGWFSLSGILLLFTPLFLLRRYPGKGGVLFKYSLVAAGTFVLTTMLFSQVLIVLRSAQGAVASLTNPQRNIAEAAFDVLSEQAEEIAAIGPALLATPLAKVASGEEDSIVSAILNNAVALNADAQVFKRIAGWFKHVSDLFGYVPMILTLLAVVAFFVSMRPVLMKIVRLPAEAAAGRASGKGVFKEIMKTLGWELVVTVFLIFVLISVTVFSGFMLATLAKPAVEALLAYGFACIFYTLAAAKTFKTLWIYVSLVGAMLFLVLNVAIVVVSSGSYIGKAQKLLRLRFHEKVPLLSQWRFWVFGTIGLIWIQTIPIVFISIAKPAVESFIEWSMKGDDPAQLDWPMLLSSGPLILVIGFVLFWLCWGLKPLLFIARYPSKAPAPALAPQPALHAAMPAPQPA